MSGDVVSSPVALEDVSLPAPALPDGLRERLEAVAEVRDDAAARVLRARGKSYLDLLASRAGEFASAPDAVVAPGSEAQAAEVLRLCGEYGVAVVPFGGGTSVVGGLAGERGRFSSLVSLDLAAAGSRGLDRSAVAGGGVRTGESRLPEADAALRAQGLALGHVPQSYEWATVGGCAATRSAGQTSTGHGRIDEQVVALSCVTPSGALSTLDAPGSAAGPSLRELVLGSEGTLGVITSVALRVRRRVEASYDAWSVESFTAGADLLRVLEQDGLAPDIARLSDEQETRTSLALAGTGPVGRRLLGGRCLLVCGWQGATGRATAARKLVRGGALPLGPSPGHAWESPASPGRTCATTCWTAACWSRPGDGDDLVEPGTALPRGAQRAARAARRLPHLAPVSVGGLAVLHRPRRAVR